MTTATKPTKVDIPSAPVSSPVPPGLNDRRADSEPIIGHFVEVTKGEYEGRYGVFIELEGETAVIRARDENSDRFTVPYTSLRQSRAGKR